ncbi:MAG: undecaprenyldiphospho-muramoylpentapeptide beta-N-acetylglucosaminyltransferase [Candidatus Cloacimonetes bacterium]|nr:undecaprenyldiphospho-muramoylpentapeptide beta-N-acetylglucosaminyltransferase [Candidatus Cloacimonadota bacterium]
MRIIFGAGGTGGHIIPALAIAREMQKEGFIPHFIGNADSLEERLVTGSNLPFHPISVQKLYRQITLAHLRFPYLLIRSIIKSRRIIRQIDPQCILCTGSYISGPVALAALLSRKPLYLHESNCYPGLAIRMLAPFARMCFLSWNRSQQYLNRARTILLGTPIFNDQFAPSHLDWTQFGLSPDRPKLLISGGSQGSLVINEMIDRCADRLIDEGYDLVWQTGRNSVQRYAGKHAENPFIHVFDFTSEMPALLMNSCIAITRAGAMTIAELECAMRPAVLIPLPTAAANHQYWNAAEQQQKGLAVLLEQKDLTAETLLNAIHRIRQTLPSMQIAFASLPPNTAARDVARFIVSQTQTTEKTC